MRPGTILFKMRFRVFFFSYVILQFIGCQDNKHKAPVMNGAGKDSRIMEDQRKNSGGKKGDLKFYRLENSDIYFLDYSGMITYDHGRSNMETIEKKLRVSALKHGCLKVIFDVRNTVWESRETHDALSKVARKVFDSRNFKAAIYIAVLNNEIEGPDIDNERWFVKKEDAIKWLTQKK
jgi:hypothetical protein